MNLKFIRRITLKRKVLSLVLALAMGATTMLSACTNDAAAEATNSPENTTPAAQTTASADPTPASTAAAEATASPEATTEATQQPSAENEKIYRYADTTDVSNLNPHMSLASTESGVVYWTTGCLYRPLPNKDRLGSTMMPELAAEEPIDTDGTGTKWNIKLREDAEWANGDPINADTFMYSYEMALDPVLGNSTVWDLMNNMIEIKNAEAYYTQNQEGNPAVDWEDVGIKKIDDYTIQIETTMKFNPLDVMRHFNTRATCPVYEPLYEELMNDTRTATTYGTDKDKLMSCGPFEITSWTKGSERIMSKNENWVHADYIKLDKIAVRIVEDANTRLQMFENGEVDYIGLNYQTYMSYEDDPRVYENDSTEITFLEVNSGSTDNPILGDMDFRKALYYGMDRQTLADLTKNKPSANVQNLVAGAYPEEGILFWDLPEAQALIPENYGYDPELAKEYFDKAMDTFNLDKLKLNLIYAESSVAWKLMSEYLQNSYAEIFGKDRFEIELTAMPYSQQTAKIKTWREDPNCYDLTFAGWVHGGTLYNPTMQYMFWQMGYSNLNGPYYNDAYDALYQESLTEEARLDQEKLVELALGMEKIFIDDVIAVPAISFVSRYMYSDRMVLPLDEYDPVLGWGVFYSDIDFNK